MIYLCHRMGMRCRAHTCLIGEQSAGHAFGQRQLDRSADSAAWNGRRVECANYDCVECVWYILIVINDYDQRANYVKGCHDWNDRLCYFRDSLHSAYKYEQCQNGNDDSHGCLRNAECRVKSCRDRVRLHGISHESKRQDDQHGKNASQHLSKGSFECGTDIVYRASCNLTVFSYLLILLSHDSLCEDRSHSKESRDPHPENCSRSAYCQRCSRSCNIAGSHLCGNRCRQRLERRHAVRSRLAFLFEQSPECPPHAFAKSPHLDKAKTEWKPQASQKERDDQNVIRKIMLDCQDNVIQCLHVNSSLLLS